MKFSRLSRLKTVFAGAAALGMVLMGAPTFADEADTPEAGPDQSAVTQPATTPGQYEYDAERTVRVSGSINQKMAEKVIEKLLALSKKDPKADIELRINSGGGSVLAGMAIYDVMKSLPNDIRTVCEGNAQSMAAFLLSAGTQGKRYAYPNCEIMYHQPSWGKSGQITDIQITAAQGEVGKKRMISIIAEDTGWSKDVIRQLLERNFYPDAKEAKEMGFIDHIIKEKNPDPAPARKTKLPADFCDNPGRKHMKFCPL